MKKYRYFVSYTFSKNNNSGNGCTEVMSKTKIKSFKDISEITEGVMSEHGYDQVFIMFWREF